MSDPLEVWQTRRNISYSISLYKEIFPFKTFFYGGVESGLRDKNPVWTSFKAFRWLGFIPLNTFDLGHSQRGK